MDKLKFGTKVMARRTIRYCLGQIPSDKIVRGEICIVDTPTYYGNDKAFTVMEHADRYGPWKKEDFKIASEKNIAAWDKRFAN